VGRELQLGVHRDALITELVAAEKALQEAEAETREG